jgi:tetratricopeptide (TPR) repeat protein
MSDTQSRAKEILVTAAAMASAEERQTYIDAQCGSDATLRGEVEQLLAHHAEAGGGGFLEPPAADTSQADLDPPVLLTPPGTVIGRYKLLEPIGEGGYGVVFMAEQTSPVQRRVALKIVKAGMDTRQVIARFEAERQALALMDHPNIAKVFDAGVTDTGRPYFVMELVKGVPITKYCDEHRLTPRDRLELFVQVCHAVQHAHQKGIIHRDLKPSNVIVALYDGKPVPKVIDFGVAKATGQQLTERTMFTGFGDVIGTPQYMSPEQAELNQLDIDTRSDIYSLGVLLYELLTGTTPIEHKRVREAALLEVLRVIREEEPPKPSTRLSTVAELPSIAAQRGLEPKKLSGLVHGELDWIVMKALEKDRSRRYDTANGFARDIERYLHDEPVQACPPSARYRLRKFLHKYRVPLAVAASFIVLLAAASVVSTWQAVRATRAEAISRANEAKARTEAAKATAISDLLQEMLSSASPSKEKAADYTVRQLLDDFSAGLGDQLKEQPEAEIAIRKTIATAYRRLALLDKAESQFRKAIELARRIRPDSFPLADLLVDYSWNVAQRGDAAGAEALAREALAIYQRRGADAKRVLQASYTVQQFLRTQSKHKEAQAVGEAALSFAHTAGQEDNLQVAAILQGLADSKSSTGQLQEAEALARRALELQRRLSDAQNTSTAWNLIVLGDVLNRQAKREEAERCYREALDIFIKNHFDWSHPSVHTAAGKLAAILKAKGDNAAVKELNLRERNALEKMLAQSPQDDRLRLRYGAILLELGEWQIAIDTCEPALVAIPARNGSSQGVSLLKFSSAYIELAHALAAQGRPEEAELVYLRGEKFFEAHAAENPQDSYYRHELGRLHNWRGLFLADQGRYQEAETAHRAALQVYEGLAGHVEGTREHFRRREIFWTYSNFALLYYRWGRGADAERATAQMLALGRQLAQEFPASRYDRWMRQLRNDIAMALATHPDPTKRLPQLAFKLASETVTEDPGDSSCWLALGNICRKYAERRGGNRSAEAAEMALKAVPFFDAASAEYEKRTSDAAWRREFAIAYEQVAIALTQTGESAAAEKAFREAQQVWMKLVAADNSEDNRWHLAINCELLGQELRQAGRLEMSVQSYQQALDTWEKLATESDKEDYRNHVTWQRATLVDLFRSQGKTAEADAVLQKAEAQCREAIRKQPGAAELHRSLADVLRDEGKLDEAIAAYSQVIARKPGDQDAWKQRGACYLRKGNLAAAAEYFTEAIKQKPDDAWYWHERAFCYECLGQHEKAIADISKAIELSDVDPDQRIRRAHSYKALGKIQQAEADYARAIELNPRFWESWHARGQLQAELGQWDKAAADFTKVIELEPKRSEGWTGRAFSHFHRQQWQQAIADFSKAIELAPDVHTNWYHRGHAYANLGKWEQAAADWGKLTEQWPNDPEGWYLRGAADMHLGRPDDALADLRQAIAKGFKDAQRLKLDGNFAPLGDNEQFKKLLASLEAKQK